MAAAMTAVMCISMTGWWPNGWFLWHGKYNTIIPVPGSCNCRYTFFQALSKEGECTAGSLFAATMPFTAETCEKQRELILTLLRLVLGGSFEVEHFLARAAVAEFLPGDAFNRLWFAAAEVVDFLLELGDFLLLGFILHLQGLQFLLQVPDVAESRSQQNECYSKQNDADEDQQDITKCHDGQSFSVAVQVNVAKASRLFRSLEIVFQLRIKSAWSGR